MMLSLHHVSNHAAAAEPQIGQPAPEFELDGTDGKTYKLADFKGKSAVVIAWFPKADTPGCTAECKSMRDNSKALKQLNVAYFAASVDEPAENKKFAEKLGLDFPILSDPTRKTALAYGVVDNLHGMARRWTFFIDVDGNLVGVDKKVNVGQHGLHIAAKLKDLGVKDK